MQRAALTVLLNQVVPEELASLERVDETIAVALPEDMLSALTTAAGIAALNRTQSDHELGCTPHSEVQWESYTIGVIEQSTAAALILGPFSPFFPRWEPRCPPRPISSR
jgi:hypothetical protein